ncbi:spermidine/putrescine transport system permease protein [Austwickia chelonae]|uniref:Putative ABC transporter permease protein n=1 Tax=Austwickia chelonae NBRC 105200 TaxID=1184607 RepID=K6VMF7_9MICO|nr:ABC transporter permease [Austwickia chelonae]GAB76535.1 putative ABC transporter permease protein [Austwickia chelonae NBRC 105200]SEW26364.1 spermidine/putrescine transport system permease protein [Austwickia chelonae]
MRALRSLWPGWILLLPGLLWLAVFFVFPLVQLGSVSLQSAYPGHPGYYYRDVNVGNYVEAWGQFAGHLGRSTFYAGAATVLAFLLALPIAYVLAFRAGRWRPLLLVVTFAPFLVAFLLRTLAWRQILSDEAPVAKAVGALGLLPEGHLTETSVAVVAGLAYNYLPFMVVPLYAALERLDPRLLEASHDLYGGHLSTLVRVTLPLATPGITAGVLLTFIPALGDYVNAELLGAESTKMAGNAVESQMLRVVGGYPVAAATSMILLVGVLVLITAYLRRFGTRELT